MEYLALILSVSLFVVMLIFLEVGRRYGLRSHVHETDQGASGKRIVEGAFFGLMSLLIAFSFSGSVTRFDHRRELIIEESNDISTAYHRVDMLAPDAQPKMRELFRSYLDSRLAVYRALPDLDAAKMELASSLDLQGRIWTLAVASTRDPASHPESGRLLLPALNTMGDIANSRTWAAMNHPPTLVIGMLFSIALICAFIAGNNLSAAKMHVPLYAIAFALLTSFSIYVILEVEYPRIGFVNIGKYDEALTEVRESMH